MYFLLLENNNNLLLGYVPETVGLLIFGGALVAITIFLRWILNEKEVEKVEVRESGNAGEANE